MSPRHLGLAALCGVLAWLGVEPLRLWPATLVCLAPLVALTLTCTPRVALLRGLLAGLAINLALFAWFIPLIHRFAKFPWIAAIPTGLGLLVWQSIPFALVGWAVARSRRPLIVAPAALVAVEFFWPTLFPWHVGFPLGRAPLLIQTADLAGHGIASLLCALTAAAVVTLPRSPKRMPVVALFLVWMAVLSYGVERMHRIDGRRAEEAARLRIGIVQPNSVGLSIRDRHAHLGRLRRATRELEARGAEVVVWPETSYSHRIENDRTADFPKGSARCIGPIAVPLIFGARMGLDRNYANSVRVLLPSGRFAGRYDKVHMVPFSERRPFEGLLGSFWNRFPATRHLAAGDGPVVLEAAGARLGPLICVEDLVPVAGRGLVREGAEIFVNLTNDSWFGTSAGPSHHLDSAIFRAVETRRDLVRVTATGISAHVDAAGRIRVESGLHDVEEKAPCETFLVDAARLDGVTIAVRIGDALPWTCFAVTLLFVLRRRRT